MHKELLTTPLGGAGPYTGRIETGARTEEKFLTWNPNSLNSSVKRGKARKSPGPRNGEWLNDMLKKKERVVAVGIQETHCASDDELCPAVAEIRDRYHFVHSPAAQGDNYAGVCLVLSREYDVKEKKEPMPGRVLSVRAHSLQFKYDVNFVVVYGSQKGKVKCLEHVEEVLDDTCTTVLMGDFNFCMNGIDRASGTLSKADIGAAAKLSEILSRMGLIDSFRHVKKEVREYTYWSGVKGVSRIDRVYMNKSLVDELIGVNHLQVPSQTEGPSLCHRIVEVEIRHDQRDPARSLDFSTC
jgi:exonuclease III